MTLKMSDTVLNFFIFKILFSIELVFENAAENL